MPSPLKRERRANKRSAVPPDAVTGVGYGGLRSAYPPYRPYSVWPLHFWSQYLVSRVLRYFVPVWVWKNRVHGTVIS
jgi:hypothetical protein